MSQKTPTELIESFESHGYNIQILSSLSEKILSKEKQRQMIEEIAQAAVKVLDQYQQKPPLHQDT